MDYIRSCYKSSMRLYSDRPDVLTTGRWYFSPEGAKVIPFQHKFGSSSWLPNGRDDSVPLGEVGARGAWTNGICPPQFDGSHFCGERSAWQNGILYADRPGLAADPFGFPLCCHSASGGGGFVAFNGMVSDPRGSYHFEADLAFDGEWEFPTYQGALAFNAGYRGDAPAEAGQLAFNGAYRDDPEQESGGLALSGSYGLGGSVSVTCCTSNLIPTNLTVVFDTAGCTFLDGTTWYLVWNATDKAWESAPFSVGIYTAYIRFECVGTVWELNILATSPVLTDLWINGGPDSATCSPFNVVMEVVGGLDSPCHTIVNHGTITPTF